MGVYYPVSYIGNKDDMPFLNKIVGMKAGQHTMNIHQFCNIPRNSLDDPYQRFH